jgi:hypothetical protein
MPANQCGGMPHPVNPVHPVKAFALNEIIGKFGGAGMNPKAKG